MSGENMDNSVVILSDLDSDDEIQFIGSNLPSHPERITNSNHQGHTVQSTRRIHNSHEDDDVLSSVSQPIHIELQSLINDDDIIVGESRPITDEITVTGERPISNTQRERYMANEVRNQGSFAGYTLAFPGVNVLQTALTDGLLPRGFSTATNIRRNGNRRSTSRGGSRRRERNVRTGQRRQRIDSNRASTLAGFVNRVLNGVGLIRDNVNDAYINNFPEGVRFLQGFETDDGNDVPRHLMDEVARREQTHEDLRISARNKIADKMKIQSEKTSVITGEQKLFFTNGISSTDDSVCVLCGVILAKGIPEEHDVIKDEEKIKNLVLKEKFRSPWQCSKKLTSIDRELSQKIFFGRCGHVYCGRCVNNVNRGKGIKKWVKRKKNKQEPDLHHVSLAQVDFDDEEFAAPKKCVAEGCNKALTGRFFFKQLYI